MNDIKPRISVVIPIYNEESSIQSILRSILQQNTSDFILHEILVLSDGSTDSSVSEVRKVKDSRITLYDYTDQQGQNARLNFAYSKCSGTIIITLDGDIEISDRNLFQHLVTAHSVHKADIVCGNPVPLAPRNFIEKVAFFGADVDQSVKAKLEDKAMRYRLIGRIFSCTKESLNGLVIPLDVSNDVYIYYYSKLKNRIITFEPKAAVYFRLPSTLHDIVQQYKRHLHTNHHIYFSKEVTQREDTRTLQHIYPIFFKKSLRHPFLSIAFVLVYLKAVVLAKRYLRTATWEYIASTKNNA
ncbi:MAG: glycosyltransferase family A protein [Patescibacteria group bacterium]